MREDLKLRANFVVNPFAAVAGTYHGLLQSSPATNAAAGTFTLSVNAFGAFSGKVIRGGVTFPMRGAFKNDGSFQGTIVDGKGGAALPLDLRLEIGGVADGLSGTFADAILQGSRVLGSSEAAAWSGSFTALISAHAPDALVRAPAAPGYATLRVSPAGGVRMAGALADGTTLSFASHLTKAGACAVYAPLNRGTGSISGVLAFSEEAPLGATGTLIWFKPAQPNALLYAAGFPFGAPVDFVASPYTPPAPERGSRPATPLLPGLSPETSNGNAKLTIESADFSTITQSLNILERGKISVAGPANPSGLSVTLSPATGLLSGHFTAEVVDPMTLGTTKVSRSFRGVVLQNESRGAGFFLGKSESGSVTLQTAP
jgi:hypothetical protein